MNPLWQFSIDFYRCPAVAAGCLAWQEQLAADVNVVLLCLWCATTGRPLKDADLRRLLADPALCRWQRDIVVSLRAVRRRSKGGEGLDEQAQARAELLRAELYQALLAAELKAEAFEQEILWYWVEGNLAVKARGSVDHVVAVARRNLQAYARILGVTDLDGVLITCFSDELSLGRWLQCD